MRNLAHGLLDALAYFSETPGHTANQQRDYRAYHQKY